MDAKNLERTLRKFARRHPFRSFVVELVSGTTILIEHPEARERMGEIGRKRIEKELAWEYSVEKLLAAYERAFSKVRGKNLLETDQARCS